MLTFQVNADTLAWKEVVLWGHIWAITAHFPRNTGNCPRSPSLKLALHQKQCSCKFLGLKTALPNTIQTTTKVNNYNYLRLKPYIILPKCLPDQFLFMKFGKSSPTPCCCIPPLTLCHGSLHVLVPVSYGIYCILLYLYCLDCTDHPI